MDRTIAAGTISAERALSYGFTGPNLRATGVDYDVRVASPYSSYNDFGVEPVASPITAFSPLAFLSRISFAIIPATYAEPSFGVENIFTGIFSRESVRSIRLFIM